MIIHIEKPKDPVKILPKIVKHFSREAVYKINGHKSIVLDTHIHTKNSMAEKIPVRTVPFKIAESILNTLE